MTNLTSRNTPWHLWTVGATGVLWNAFGSYDYFMTQTRGEAYMHSMGMTNEQISHMNAMPSWMMAVWAVGVWGGLTGAILVLLKNKLAVPVFAASLAAFVLSLIYAYGVSPMPGDGAAMLAMQAVILAGCIFFLWYAFWAKKQGLLN